MYLGVGLQNQVLVLSGKQSRRVNELQVMKSSELYVDQRTLLCRVDIKCYRKEVVYRLNVWAV